MSNKNMDKEFDIVFLNYVKKVRVFILILLIISFMFIWIGFYSYVKFKLDYGEVNKVLIGKVFYNNTIPYIKYDYVEEYAYTRLLSTLLFALFFYGLTHSMLILTDIYNVTKQMIEENKYDNF